MKISFIIVNYNTRHCLEKCIISLLNNVKNAKFEIIVVNNEEKEISDIIKDANVIPGLCVIEINENVGFGRACNVGAKKATGEILCFLNPDAEVISKNINKIIEEIDNDSSVGVIGPRIMEKSGAVQPWSAGRELTFVDLMRNNLGFPKSKKIWECDEKQHVDWVTGAALFSRKETFHEIEGFDENFFLYFEDIDLCKRVRVSGKKVVHFPHFQIIHAGGESMSSEKKQKEYYYASQDYYFKKHFGTPTSFLVKVCRLVYTKAQHIANKAKQLLR